MILEKKSGVLFIAGIVFFGIAFISNAVVPSLMYKNLPEKSAERLVNANLRFQFEDLAKRYPEAFSAAFGPPPYGSEFLDPSQKKENEEREAWLNQTCADALRKGRDVYVAEGCWHCHSQFVRPVSNEEKRWGPVSKSEEYQNELQRPVLFGTRRVGPDLCREGGRHSNDWQAVHFFKPSTLSVGSPMPEYPWLFNGSPDKPTKRGLALITYVQWLGSWLDSYPYYEQYEANPVLNLKPKVGK